MAKTSSTITGGATGAGTGALIGSAIAPGVGTLIGAGAGALLGGLSGFFGGSAEEEMAAQAQAVAMAQLEEQRRLREEALGYAQPSMEELQLMGQQLQQAQSFMNFQQQELGRAEKMLNAIDPAILESSRQIYDMLQGKSSPFLAPIERQRAEARRQLSGALQDEMGPGALASTAGVKALNAYDTATGDMLTQGRFQAIQGLGNVGLAQRSSALSAALGATGTGAQLTSNAFASRDAIARRKIAALEGTSLTPYAGAENTGAYLQGQINYQNSQQLMGLLGNVGGTAAGIYLGNNLGNKLGNKLGKTA